MAYGRGGNRGGSRGGSRKESNYTRVGNLFESKFVPDKAREQLSTRCDGKYLDAVREVLNNNDAVYFTFTVWNDGEHPVLSVAPAKEGGSRGGSRGGYSDRGSRGTRSSRPDTTRGSRDVRDRGIENEPQDDAGDDTEQDNNWDK